MRRGGREAGGAAEPRHYRARPASREWALARIASRLCACAAALALGACAIAIPLSPFGGSEPMTTGSIGPVSPLDPDLDVEDWRRARAAMAVALDPQGNGAAAAWENPETGRKGEFAAASRPYARDDRVCRDFRAVLSAAGGPDRVISGAACRMSENGWRIDRLDEDAPRRG